MWTIHHRPSRRHSPYLLHISLLAAAAVHLPLLLMKLPLKSYDTNFHIFFASHYLHHWFDPWNAKWYAGFSQTTYPPLPQQWTALLSNVFGLDLAYMAVQFVAILLLVVGVYRFSRFWVSPTGCFDCRAGSCFSRLREFPCLLRGATRHHFCRADLSDRTSVPVRVDQARQLALFRQSKLPCLRPPPPPIMPRCFSDRFSSQYPSWRLLFLIAKMASGSQRQSSVSGQ